MEAFAGQEGGLPPAQRLSAGGDLMKNEKWKMTDGKFSIGGFKLEVQRGKLEPSDWVCWG
jgi:hypothetical protein